MPCHVAIVVAPYDRLILSGRKTIECRLTKSRMPPFGCVVPGERIYFKRSGGRFFATAVADRVWMTDRLTPELIDALRKEHDRHIRGSANYYRSHRDARFGTLVWLREVEGTAIRPAYKAQHMRAWQTLVDEADPMARAPDRRDDGPFDVALTPGAIAHKCVRLAGVLDRFPPDAIGGRTRQNAGRAIRLKLDGTEAIETDIVGDKKMIRWRGWGPWFLRHGLKPGDRLRFTPGARHEFIVEPAPRRDRS